MIPLGIERFRDLAHKVATGTASDAMRKEFETIMRAEPALSREFDQVRREALLFREILPLMAATEAAPRKFPISARERMQTKVRAIAGRSEACPPESVELGATSEQPTAAVTPGGKRRILVVDDEKSLTSLLKLNLEETGNYDVRTENWAEDALPAAREFRPDLVLLDIIMPRMPGGDVVAQFRNDPELKSTPIVFITAAVAPHIVEEMEGRVPAAFEDLPCLAKPVTLEKVIETIEKYARKTSGEA